MKNKIYVSELTLITIQSNTPNSNGFTPASLIFFTVIPAPIKNKHITNTRLEALKIP